jgi:diguanylate cyclase (GGDEF)-like protein/PAS domain S-box-containing protein
MTVKEIDPTSRSLPKLVLGFGLLFCVVLAGMEAWREWAAYRGEIRDAQAVTLNLAKSLAQHADDTFDIADTMLIGLAERVRNDGTSSHAVARLDDLIRERLSAQPRVSGLFIYDDHGEWLASSAQSHGQSNNSDRDYFRHHRESDDSHPYLGAPVRSRSGGQWIVTLSRRLQNRDGSFAGVVLATVDVRYLTDFYRSFSLGKDGNIVLIKTDGPVVARFPFDDSYLNVNLAQSELIKTLAERRSGTRQYTSPLDQVERISGFQTASRFPVVVQVAQSREDVLADWRREASIRVVAVGIVVLLVGFLAQRLAAQMHRHQRTELALAESEQQFRLLAENSRDMVSRIGHDGVRRYVSPASLQLLGYAPEQLVGRPVFEGVNPADLPALRIQIDALKEGRISGATVPFRTRHRDGREIWVEASVRIAKDPVSGLVDGVVAVARDITERVRLEEQLAALARFDALTGIANRRAFDETLAVEWARASRAGEPVSLLLLDVDHFKSFNDTYGHPAGDACLRLVAQAVAGACGRAGDFVARYGGEEFVVLLPRTSLEGATAVGERVRTAIEGMAHPHRGNQPVGVVTVSVGIATVDPTMADSDLGAPVQRADEALYLAKRNGRNRVEVALPIQVLDAA